VEPIQWLMESSSSDSGKLLNQIGSLSSLLTTRIELDVQQNSDDLFSLMNRALDTRKSMTSCSHSEKNDLHHHLHLILQGNLLQM
jgi:hypothetical protein